MEELLKKTQKAVQVQTFGFDGIICTEIPMQSSYQFVNGDFLAKVIAAPLAPLDYWKINGKVPGLACPIIVGTEAYGQIIDCPSHSDLIGKFVAFSTKNGGFQEYSIGNVTNAIMIEENEDPSSAACAFVNPLTTIGLLARCQELKAQAIVSTAANSQVGKMIIRYGKVLGIKVISICRGAENLKNLKEKEQAEYVLDMNSEKFAENFKQIAGELNATVCVDSLGGDLAGVLFNNMPLNSVLICYGSVLGALNGIDGFQTRWANKKLEGFVLFRWWNQVSEEEKKKLQKVVAMNLKNVFKSEIKLQAKFQDAPKLIKQYKDSLSGGKIIFSP